MTFFLKKWVLALCLGQCLWLSGCGFHLRNQNTLPASLQHLEVISTHPYGDFTKQLTRELALLKTTSTARQGSAQLFIHEHNLKYRLPIIGSSQQARIYRYTFSMTYSLKLQQHTVINHRNITVSQLLTLNQNALLTTNNQLDLLTTELQRAAINQLINELKSLPHV